MSYILEALRKADAQRERDPVIGLHVQTAQGAAAQAAPNRLLRWGGVVAGAAALAGAGAAWWVRGDTVAPVESRPALTARAVAPVQAAAASPVVSPAAQAAATPPIASPTAQAAATPPIAPATAHATATPPIASPTAQATAVAPVADAILPPPPPPALQARAPSEPARRSMRALPEQPKQQMQGRVPASARRDHAVAQVPAGSPPVAVAADAGRESDTASPAALAADSLQRPAPAAGVLKGPTLARAAESVERPTLATAERIVAFSDLPAQVQRELPKLQINGGIHSADAAQRRLIVGGQVLGEGAQVAPEVTLEQIRPRSAVLRYRDWRYSIGY